MSGRIGVALALLVSVLVLMPRVGLAAISFTPIPPAACPSPTTFSYAFRVGGGTGVFDLPSDPNCTTGCPKYINRVENRRTLLGNRYTSYMNVRLSSFELEKFIRFFEVEGKRLCSLDWKPHRHCRGWDRLGVVSSVASKNTRRSRSVL